MGKRLAKSKPTWADVKTNLANFDRAALLGVLQDLYQADEANRAFLHARFGLGDDPLRPYKKIIDGWLWPDVFRGQQASVSKAKVAITRHKRALGDRVSVAELLVFYCERGRWILSGRRSSRHSLLRCTRANVRGGSEGHGQTDRQGPEWISYQARARAEYRSQAWVWCWRQHGCSVCRA